MTVSLNEVDALAKKAVRGAGYAWGIAEDAGKAVRWLCARDVDGCAALARFLDGPEREGLCPLTAGVALSDAAEGLWAAPLQLQGVLQPVLLVPFAGMAARAVDSWVSVEWDGAQVWTDGTALSVAGHVAGSRSDVTVALGRGPSSGALRRRVSRAAPTAATQDVLLRFAHLTYAPATEASRLSGAGAGVSDND